MLGVSGGQTGGERRVSSLACIYPPRAPSLSHGFCSPSATVVIPLLCGAVRTVIKQRKGILAAGFGDYARAGSGIEEEIYVLDGKPIAKDTEKLEVVGIGGVKLKTLKWVKQQNRTQELKRYGLGWALDMTKYASTNDFQEACVEANKIITLFHCVVLGSEQRSKVPPEFLHGKQFKGTCYTTSQFVSKNERPLAKPTAAPAPERQPASQLATMRTQAGETAGHRATHAAGIPKATEAAGTCTRILRLLREYEQKHGSFEGTALGDDETRSLFEQSLLQYMLPHGTSCLPTLNIPNYLRASSVHHVLQQQASRRLSSVSADVNDHKGAVAAIVSRGEGVASFDNHVGFEKRDGALGVAGLPVGGQAQTLINSACAFMRAANAEVLGKPTHTINWIPVNTISLVAASTQFHCPRDALWRDVLINYATASIAERNTAGTRTVSNLPAGVPLVDQSYRPLHPCCDSGGHPGRGHARVENLRIARPADWCDWYPESSQDQGGAVAPSRQLCPRGKGRQGRGRPCVCPCQGRHVDGRSACQEGVACC